MKPVKILVVDDERIVRESIHSWLKEAGFEPLTASSGLEALEILEQEEINLFIIDLKMPGMDGIELFREIKRKIEPALAVFISAYGTVESAVIAMKEGAFDFIEKPFCPERVELIIKKMIEHLSLTEENIQLRREIERRFSFHNIIGKSPKIQRVFELIETVSKANTTVLIQGETGTGKELVAKAIHYASDRKNNPFVIVSCANIPESLLESELFGHEKGSFTGAIATKKGKFEIAHKGTLFLDEVGELPFQLQAHLLRVLQEKEFTRIGGNEVIKVDVRVVSATNRNLWTEVREGRFREDLFYRLNVITIEIPSLRERREDIMLLANHFLKKYSEENKKEIKGFTKRTTDFLMSYEWPGNVRELENFIEHAVVVCPKDLIDFEDLPLYSVKRYSYGNSLKSLKDVEREHIENVLRETEWNMSKTASILGISRVTLYYKIKEYNITRNSSKN
ncbi:MAG: sigma-54-dependent transcriptional regulator [Candidatus Aminicenantia bacterium]